jgi:hypothetical protein
VRESVGKIRPPKWGVVRRKSSAFNPKSDRLRGSHTRQQLDGKTFASKLEAAVYLLLKAEEAAGRIQDLRTQPSVTLVAGIRMIPDFCYLRDGKLEYAEAKGHVTDVWALKLRLWRVFGPAPLRIFKGTYRRPVEVECVVPKPVQ